MKKIYFLFVLFVGSFAFGQTIYSENFGTPSATTLITAYTGFQNSSPIVYSGSGDVRTSSASNYSGASGSGNVFLTNTTGKYLQIDGINTSSYQTANIKLSFGYLTSATTAQLVVEYSTNASATTPTWTGVTFTNNTTTSWALVTTAGGILPSSSTLSLRFTQPGTTAQMRIDDIKVFNFNPACTLQLGTPVAVCDATTLGIDKYTTTIPYTGGGSGTYTITPSSGTVSGNNPGATAAGNIIISGVNEGTDLTLNIVSGTCSYPVTVTAPECKIINPLPYYDGFAYTAGTSLGTSQLWTNINSGATILASAGSLTYAGITPTGNSVTLTGAGIDGFTPFTSTTTGTIYTQFLFKVSDLTNVTDTKDTYFAALTTSTKSYLARLFLKRSGTQYQIGFDTNSTTTNYDATLRNTGDVVRIVIGYDFSTNYLTAWINPVTNAGPTFAITPSAFTNLGGFILRQDTATTTPTIVFDELRIVTSLNDLGLTLSTNHNEIAGLKVYPNPVVDGKLYVSSDSNSEKTIAVFDVLGKQILNTVVTNDIVNVSSLTSGIYIVKITEDGKTDTKKLVIK